MKKPATPKKNTPKTQPQRTRVGVRTSVAAGFGVGAALGIGGK